MRVLIAPDSFKGSLSALDAARAMERGVKRVFAGAECDCIPMADGGEGTVAALVAATRGRLLYEQVRDPLGRSITAVWGLSGDGRTAFVEMASASGLPLVRPPHGLDERDPLRACTYGTGQLIRAALRALHGEPPETSQADEIFAEASGHAPAREKTETATRPLTEAPRLIIGLGGSATNDGGAGCLRALGARFLDARGQELPPGGSALADLARIDDSGLDPLLGKTEILVACDVDNPLCGPRGASAVFGPQKGATPAMVRALDAALARYGDIARRETGKDAADTPGAGAAGGLGAGLLFFTGATLMPGVEIVLRATDFEARAGQADLVLTGEGHTDFQTAYGKAPAGVAKTAKRSGKPVVCISGGLGQGADDILALGVDAVAGAVCSVHDLDYCMEHAAELLETAVERTCRMIRLGMGLSHPSGTA